LTLKLALVNDATALVFRGAMLTDGVSEEAMTDAAIAVLSDTSAQTGAAAAFQVTAALSARYGWLPWPALAISSLVPTSWIMISQP
jgi:hypothetical protein